MWIKRLLCIILSTVQILCRNIYPEISTSFWGRRFFSKNAPLFSIVRDSSNPRWYLINTRCIYLCVKSSSHYIEHLIRGNQIYLHLAHMFTLLLKEQIKQGKATRRHLHYWHNNCTTNQSALFTVKVTLLWFSASILLLISHNKSQFTCFFNLYYLNYLFLKSFDFQNKIVQRLYS